MHPTEDTIKRTNERVNKAYFDGHISDGTSEYLLVNSGKKEGRFYHLPKLHKKGYSSRPAISGCNTPVEKISEFVDHHLKPLATIAPSYVKGTDDFLRKLQHINTPPDGAMMVTSDVLGL